MIPGQTLFVITMSCLLYMIYTLNHYVYCRDILSQVTISKIPQNKEAINVCQVLKNTLNPISNSLYKSTIENYYNLVSAAKLKKLDDKFLLTKMGTYEVHALKYVHLLLYLMTLYYCFLIFPSIIFEIIKKFYFLIVYALLFCVLIELIMQELDSFYKFSELFETKRVIKRILGLE